MSIRRTKQTASIVKEELARLLLQEVADPRLQDLVITDLELTADLGQASIYFTKGAFAESLNEKETLHSLKRATPFLRKKIGQSLKLRKVPELFFKLDTHGDSLGRILGLLEDVSGPAESASQSASQAHS